MAFGKYQEWQEPDNLTLLQSWARDGLTYEQIAHNIGINAKTLYAWKNEHSKICNALKKGKEVVDFEVENALLKKALSGDVGAMCFWLKNRKPAVWKDRRESTIDIRKTQEEATDETLALLEEIENEECGEEAGNAPKDS